MPIIFNSPAFSDSDKSQIENFQTTLASLNQQVIFLQEALLDRDQEIADLKERLSEYTAFQPSQTWSGSLTAEKQVKIDETLTIIGALIKLYQYIFPPGKSDQ